MAVQKQSMPSFASIITALSIVFYSVGFLRVELELNEQKKRLNTLESVAEAKSPSKNADMKIIKNASVQYTKLKRHRRQLVDLNKNSTEAEQTAEAMLKINKLLSEGRLHLCQSNGVTCSSGPPGPPGSPGPRGHKGARGRRGQKGRTGNKGDQGIMGSPGRSGKQGIMGPVGLQGKTGNKGEKGDIGTTGMPGTKGEPGESISSPAVVVSPVALTVNEGGTASFQCSASGNPEPAVTWSKLNSQSQITPSAISGGKLELNKVTGSYSGMYRCSATNILGNASEVVRLAVNDCSDLLKSGHTQSGLYSVNPDGRGHFTVYCDMRTDCGGWTVFQRRQDGSVDFYRGWNDYKAGFGHLTAEFWLGNDKIHRLTASRPSSLRVELEDWKGVKVYAKYGKFNISDEQAQYRLEVGSYSGTAGDSLAYHNNMAFTTKDRDNDSDGGSNCAVQFTGAWWYYSCHSSNLNGQYLGDKGDCRGANWSGFKGCLSLKFTEMKLRPSL